ncbi:46 kDa FK506-binding nuclear protein [Cajanus cajan]|uniref:Uncharacterized protein n=1 Tax=Cajanus cajan TaxID=3821 RepID=A0A151RJG8_CAJCA|nr:46 kDa FK506-binding nuclear protein [Cajanus cajan]KYP42710.1 hypothetical protein KK1_035857 [Cajanus cajan]
MAGNNSNIFAALGSLKKKKSKSKDEASSKPRGSQEPEKKDVFWAPTPLTAKSWADVDDEDDDDYYATTAPLESAWLNPEKANESEAAAEESESDEEGFDDEEDDVEDDHENDLEIPEDVKPVLDKPAQPSLATKDTERQLSKKELKKKGLEELEAVLAELGYTQGEPSGHDDSHGVEKKENDQNGAVIKENVSVESKSARKKKKKDKSSKEQKESQDQSDGMDVGSKTSETAGIEKAEDVSSIDVKERLKKVTSMKKKKSSKEMDAAARAAASEAAARSAKLAAAKKKEKAHYNQQPVR